MPDSRYSFLASLMELLNPPEAPAEDSHRCERVTPLRYHSAQVAWNPLAGQHQCRLCRDEWTARELQHQ